jgi:hypothetical protein
MFLPRRTVTFLQFTRKVFNAVSFGCEQHDEVIQQISSFINQALQASMTVSTASSPTFCAILLIPDWKRLVV